MTKLIEKKTKRRFYGIKISKLGGWAVYEKDRSGELQQHVFVIDEIFAERFIQVLEI